MQRSLLRSLGIALFPFIALAPIESNAIDSIVVFNEINYHPAENNHLLEFIEIYNQNSVNVDLTGWKLTGGVDYSFNKNTIIQGGSYMVIALDPETIKEVSGLAQVLGPYEGRLDNAGETIRLKNNNGRIMDRITYNDKDPWPVSADGSGATLSKLIPMTASSPPDNWTSSPQISGTPGKINFQDSDLPPPTVKVPILSFDQGWRFNESGADLGPEWATEEHSLSEEWKFGRGVHARENRLEVDIGTELIRTSSNKPYVITYYFETEFNLTEAQFSNAYELQLTYLIDDGAIFYINGKEVYRYNMPFGEVNSSTLASSGSEAKKSEPIGIAISGLRSGQNR
ncbi:lamin tail domain-containing protein, partial [Verrucomicrobia bacterium]|nr:lamin tail domain-containing protein [Verrucomicrobiota bacterium]